MTVLSTAVSYIWGLDATKEKRTLHKTVLELNIVHISRLILKIIVTIFLSEFCVRSIISLMSLPVRQICSQVVRSCIFHPYDWFSRLSGLAFSNPAICSRVVRSHVRFSPLLFVAGLSRPAFSTPAICSSVVRPCVFNHCDY